MNSASSSSRQGAWRLAAGALAISVLAGCASDDEAKDSETASTTTSTVAEVATSTTSADVASDDEATGVGQDQVTLVLEAWNTDVRSLWDTVLAEFEQANPGIDVVYQPTNASDYDEALRNRFDAGVGGDIITCRPFDVSLGLFQDGYLADLSDMSVMADFSDGAKLAWTTDDGASTFCVPVSSVVHGYFYNKDAFAAVGVSPPATMDEFLSLLQAFADDGRYVPISVAAGEPWRPGNHVFQTLGPTFWGGEEGRQALVAGEISLDDDRFVDLFTAIGEFGVYLPDGAGSMATDDAIRLFEFGDAAIYPAGSWEIDEISDVDFEIGAFPPPPVEAANPCEIIDHPDLALGLNPASPNLEPARLFLEWVASSSFATAYVTELSGQFSLSPFGAEPSSGESSQSGLSAEFDTWRQECGTSARLTTQVLERGPFSMEQLIWDESQAVMLGERDAAEAATALQKALESWYVPAAD